MYQGDCGAGRLLGTSVRDVALQMPKHLWQERVKESKQITGSASPVNCPGPGLAGCRWAGSGAVSPGVACSAGRLRQFYLVLQPRIFSEKSGLRY